MSHPSSVPSPPNSTTGANVKQTFLENLELGSNEEEKEEVFLDAEEYLPDDSNPSTGVFEED
jgi:hypothetical protein